MFQSNQFINPLIQGKKRCKQDRITKFDTELCKASGYKQITITIMATFITMIDQFSMSDAHRDRSERPLSSYMSKFSASEAIVFKHWLCCCDNIKLQTTSYMILQFRLRAKFWANYDISYDNDFHIWVDSLFSRVLHRCCCLLKWCWKSNLFSETYNCNKLQFGMGWV